MKTYIGNDDEFNALLNDPKFLEAITDAIASVATEPPFVPIDSFFVKYDPRVRKYIYENYARGKYSQSENSHETLSRLVHDAERAFGLDVIIDMYDLTYIDTKMPNQAQEGLI